MRAATPPSPNVQGRTVFRQSHILYKAVLRYQFRSRQLSPRHLQATNLHRVLASAMTSGPFQMFHSKTILKASASSGTSQKSSA